MARRTLYIISESKMDSQMVGDNIMIKLSDTEECVGNCMGRDYFVMFGVDDKDVRYMTLNVCRPRRNNRSDWLVKLRKNFKDADEGNRYYLYFKKFDASDKKGTDVVKFTEKQLDAVFSGKELNQIGGN